MMEESRPAMLFLLLLLFTITLAATITTSAVEVEVTTDLSSTTKITISNFLAYYSKHCSDIVPEQVSDGTHMDFRLGQDKILHFDIANFTGGHRLLSKDYSTSPSSSVSLSFHPQRNTIFLTHNPNLVKLEASLRFHFPLDYNLPRWNRNFRKIRFRAPRIPVKSRSLGFQLYGFWSMSEGKLCMVGSSRSADSLDNAGPVDAVLKLDYPVSSSNVNSLIRGVLESLQDKGSLSYFEPVQILGIPHFGEYNYTLVKKGDGSVCSGGNVDGGGGNNDSLNLDLGEPTMCLSKLYRHARTFELDYGSDCFGGGGKCNPFGEAVGSLPKFMTLQGIRCEFGGGIRVLVGFSDSVYHGSGPFGVQRAFDPNRMLVGEGSWDETNNRLCVAACRVLNFKDSFLNASVGDCSIRLSLRLPRTWSIAQRSTSVGQIWSNKSIHDNGYFGKIRFYGSGNRYRGLSGLKYNYTMLDRARISCGKKKTAKGRAKTYPNVFSLDMRFDMSVRNLKGQAAQGYAGPLFVGDWLFKPYYTLNNNLTGPMNISYTISFTTTSNFAMGAKLLSNESVEISAEGTYDTETGLLCMIGCRHLTSSKEISIQNASVDCEILVTVQFSPLNGKGRGNTKGTIESLRGSSDALHFGQLEISSNSIYTSQAAESIWRMDVEITMVLISNTLACIFIGLQLYHVKKYPEVLSSISFMMLGILTLGHMIPLLLNFEALFMANSNRQGVFLGTGGWLEVNEVIVRAVTMVAFLLQLRLLQLTWSARKTDESHKKLWQSEKKVLCLALPLYIAGAVIAWYVFQWKNSHKSLYLRPRHMGFQQNYAWRDFKSYAGLIMDGFLLPQIMFNLFLNSKERVLASPFYIGITTVRILPHAYDLYRAHSSTWYLDLSYIYANHRQDFYSTAWDIIIPFGGLLFAALINLQQRFGGCCILPKRFRETSEYEKVPVVNGEEPQGEAIRQRF